PVATTASRGRAPRTPMRAAVARIACRFAAPAVVTRIPDSYGFGVTPQPVPHPMSPTRIGNVGMAAIPFNGATPVLGDIEVAYIPLLDLAAPIRRVTIGASQIGSAMPAQRMYEARLGYLLGAKGQLDSIAIG